MKKIWQQAITHMLAEITPFLARGKTIGNFKKNQ
jgi:hypothetical protein